MRFHRHLSKPPNRDSSSPHGLQNLPLRVWCGGAVDGGTSACYACSLKIDELGVPALFHTGTNALGAGTPGGMGVKLDYTRPIYLDTVAADFQG